MTALVETHRATIDNGPSVIDGNLLWTSASGITTADPQSIGGCLRKWHYDTVQGKKAEATEAQKGGTALHAEIENHLLTGASLTSAKALAGRMFVDVPGSGLHVEKPILFETRDGIKIYGHVDLYNLRQRYVDPDGVLQQDPAYSFEVKDWKTTKDFVYAKTSAELGQNIQLVTYAEAGFRMWPDLEHARLTHVYFRTQGRPDSKLVTIRRSREEITTRWEYAETVVRSMQHAARETNADRVPANKNACNAYSGCPHRGICSEHNFNSLDNLYAKIGKDFKEPPPMGIIASNPQIMNQQPAPQAQPDLRAQLAAEEAQQRAQVAQQQQQMPSQAASPNDLVLACQRIQGHGRGFPAVGGNALQPYAQICGVTSQMAPDYVFKGMGNLGSVTLSEVWHFFKLADDLDAERNAPPVVQAPPTFVVTSPPQVTGVAQTVPYQQTPTPQGSMQTFAPQAQTVSFLAPNAPQSMPQLAAAHVPANPVNMDQPNNAVAIMTQNATAEEPKKGRGRPKKDKSQDTAPEAAAAVAAQAGPPPAQASAPATQAPPVTASAYIAPVSGQSHTIGDSTPRGAVLVNARSSSLDTKSLAGYVERINAKLSKRYSVHDDGSPGIQDVRCAPKGSPLAFGGWPGVVRECVKAEPPEPDAYHLDTNGDLLNETVAAALEAVAEANGWLFVRGVRS